MIDKVYNFIIEGFFLKIDEKRIILILWTLTRNQIQHNSEDLTKI